MKNLIIYFVGASIIYLAPQTTAAPKTLIYPVKKEGISSPVYPTRPHKIEKGEQNQDSRLLKPLPQKKGNARP